MRTFVSWTVPDYSFTEKFAEALIECDGSCMSAEVLLDVEIECEGCPFYCEDRISANQWESLAYKKAYEWLMNVKLKNIIEE